MAIFGDIFASCISSEPRVRTKATPCVEVWQTSTLRPLKLGEEKKKNKKEEEEEERNHRAKKYNSLPYYIGRP